MKRTVCEINLNQFRTNIQDIKQLLGPETQFLLSVKSDGYGIGMLQAATTAAKNGVDYLGTASLDEAITLREHHIKLPILVFSQPFENEHGDYIAHNITPSIYTLKAAEELNEAARKAGRVCNIHVNIDTGMGRNGLQVEEAFEHIHKIINLPYLNIEGIYSHMAEGSKPFSSYTHAQVRNFVTFIKELKLPKRVSAKLHVANSDTLSNFPQYKFDMARIGLRAYKDVITLKARIAFIKHMKAGDYVGYERSYALKNDATIAVVSIGYGDGYPFELSNKGTVLIGEQFYPIAGRVCMDHIMVNLGENPKQFAIGEEVVALGKQGASSISVDDLARLCKTVPYEILTRQSHRPKKVYVD